MYYTLIVYCKLSLPKRYIVDAEVVFSSKKRGEEILIHIYYDRHHPQQKNNNAKPV